MMSVLILNVLSVRLWKGFTPTPNFLSHQRSWALSCVAESSSGAYHHQQSNIWRPLVFCFHGQKPRFSWESQKSYGGDTPTLTTFLFS
ncbi:Hypothetical predicted protein [Podarcis lilfordi]|nr:Hypothetical predicted protein [Podarcis lilfordi]